MSSRRHRSTPAAEVRTPRAARPARTLQRTVPCHRCGCSLPTPRPAADLPGPGRNTGEAEPLRAMAESNPLWGFPRLRRAAVRSCGGVREVREVWRLETGRRGYCSTDTRCSLGQFGAATRRLGSDPRTAQTAADVQDASVQIQMAVQC